MGVQDTGCFNTLQTGYGVVRGYDGQCRYYPNNQYIRPNFKMGEFNPANVFPYGIVEKLVDQLQTMRNTLGSSIIITSGYRQQADTHGSGLAVDIVVPYRSFIQVAQAAYNAGFRRIEVMKRLGTSYANLMSVGGHVHLDVYDGSGITPGQIYTCSSCTRLPCFPWYAWGIQGGWYATSQPNTFDNLLANLSRDAGDTGYRGC